MARKIAKTTKTPKVVPTKAASHGGATPGKKGVCVMMIEPEPPEALSARKLVLETGKHNVITAHSGRHGLSLFTRFPAIDVVILHASIQDLACDAVCAAVKSVRPDLPIVLLAPRDEVDCDGADHILSSHDPQALLDLIDREFIA